MPILMIEAIGAPVPGESVLIFASLSRRDVFAVTPEAII